MLCTNTMHKVADAIEAAVDIPLLHLADVTADAVRAAGLDRVALLGTRFTMEQPFYADRLRSHGIDVLVPEGDDLTLVHDVIYDELVLGVVRDESRAAYVDVVRRLVEQGAGGVVLGCTEIELLIGPDDVDVPGLRHDRAARAGRGRLRAQLSRDDRVQPVVEPLELVGSPNIGGLPGGGR